MLLLRAHPDGVPTQLRREQLPVGRQEGGEEKGAHRASLFLLFLLTRNAIKPAAQTQHTGGASCWGKSERLQHWEREVMGLRSN